MRTYHQPMIFADIDPLRARDDEAVPSREHEAIGTSPGADSISLGPRDAEAPPRCWAECALALALFVLTSPLLVIAVLLVKLTSRGPAIYSQERVGYRGRVFTLYKVRSMEHDCERLTGPRWATKSDPRVTVIGRFLRRSHLDELPQLWNVLRGDMSLVGPRPERPEFVAMLERVIPHYRDRLTMKPGITGLAQVQLPPDSDLHGVRQKLACDLFYIRGRSAWLDLKIVASTGLKVVGLPCPVSCRLFRIPTGEAVEEVYENWTNEPARLTQVRPA